ncbi:MAG TPA: YkgJ family cysteine cluster protein [Acidobacteriaceae bacterium]|nr:YkgJ family cysteine cluster protein [Acidobacteriaceae bacterium]
MNGMGAKNKVGNEDEFSRQLGQVERRAVKSIVESAKPDTGIAFRILNNSRTLAEMAYESNRSPDAKPVACKENCRWCCYQSVRISAVEAVSIANYLRGIKDTAERDAMTERLQRLDATTRGLLPEVRNETQASCAFLTDSRCGIYPVRPMACSWYTSWDLEECKVRYEIGVEKSDIHMDHARTVVYSAVREGMKEGLVEAVPHLEKTDLELTAAVVDALKWENPEAEWLAGNPIFANAHMPGKAK